MPSVSGSLIKEFPRLMGVINLTTDSFSDGGYLFSGNKVDLSKSLRKVEKLINEEMVFREIVSKTLIKELEVKNNGFLTSSKCLFLFSLEKFGGKSVSKKYEEIVLKKFEEITDNFKTFINKDIIDQIK